MPSLILLASLLAGLSNIASSYKWPDDNDHLEAILYQQTGYRQFTLAVGVVPCDSQENSMPVGIGRTDSAEWYRNAFHDMATHDVDAGTGGVDASIAFETMRDENKGKAFLESLSFFRGFQSSRSSMSDLIALGALFSVGSCSDGKIQIPFRGGRIDATGPGPTGVPEPQQDLATHTEKFRKQGFNVSEMIGLVACGHTLGGVHGVDFPTIVPFVNNTPNAESRQDFDATVAHFDNSVAMQFVANTSQNPLAFGHNVTTRSDNRIFLSDGGVLIGKMAKSNDFYLNTCNSLLERMLNTVPKNVQLSEVITPIKIKPIIVEVSVNPNNTMTFHGEVRIIENGGIGKAATREVTVNSVSRSGGVGSSSAATTNSDLVVVGLYPNLPAFRFYQWTQTVPISQGISGFTFTIKDTSSGQTIVATNGGEPFAFQDALVVQTPQSCIGLSFPDIRTNRTLKLTVAARDNIGFKSLKVNIPVPSVAIATPAPEFLDFMDKFDMKSFDLVKGSPIGKTGYTSYSLQYSLLYPDLPPVMTFDLVGSDGKTEYSDKFRQWNDLPSCPDSE